MFRFEVEQFLEMLESDCETIRDEKTKKLLSNYIEDLQEILDENENEGE